jgi:hypothetical protein
MSGRTLLDALKNAKDGAIPASQATKHLSLRTLKWLLKNGAIVANRTAKTLGFSGCPGAEVLIESLNH